jgi:cytochrome c biogenesis protein CcdA
MSTLPLPIAAFFAGLVSFLSPCVLPLVPGYVSLISGVGVQELRSQESQSLRKVMLNSVGFILGFSIVFIALGAISPEVGQLLAQYKSTLARLAGVVIVIFGFHLTGIFRINVQRCGQTRPEARRTTSCACDEFVGQEVTLHCRVGPSGRPGDRPTVHRGAHPPPAARLGSPHSVHERYKFVSLLQGCLT